MDLLLKCVMGNEGWEMSRKVKSSFLRERSLFLQGFAGNGVLLGVGRPSPDQCLSSYAIH